MRVGRRRTAAGIVGAGAALALLAPAAPAAAETAGSPAGQHAEPLPLDRLFDNTAVSEDSRPRHADFDGRGDSLSAQDLRAAGWTPGRTLAIDGAALRWPRAAPGQPDNVTADGQAVRLWGAGDALSFLVAGTGGAASGTGTIRYRDGSHGTYRLTAPDWRDGPPTTQAVGLPHVNTATGQLARTARLYTVTVPVRQGEEITSVVLPEDPGPTADLHVFAVSIRQPAGGWTGSWSASTAGYTAVGPWIDQTLRLVVHTSAGGPRARIRLANTFAPGPARIGHATIALRADGATARGTPVPLTFQGRRGAVIPAGAELVSDPVTLGGPHRGLPPDTDLLVSIHLPGTVSAVPVHPQATQHSYLSAPGSGDRTADLGGEAYPGSLTSWPFLTGVDVEGGPGSVVTLGDSITDGTRSTSDTNSRWPDVLARRLLGQGRLPAYGVLNQGISANRIVTDRYPGDGVSTETGGVSAQHRLERDVLAQTGVRTVVIFEGINDVRAGTSADEVTAGLRAIAERAHSRGIRVVAATVAPCEGYPDCTPEVEARRVAVNAFLRADDRVFDAVLDFDAVVRDPQWPQRILPGYDSGDHLHPGDTGLKAIADSIDLRLLDSDVENA